MPEHVDPSKRRPRASPEPPHLSPRKRQKSMVDTAVEDKASSEVGISPTMTDSSMNFKIIPVVEIVSFEREEVELQNARQRRAMNKQRVVSEKLIPEAKAGDRSVTGTPIIYEEADDELAEDDNLQIFGETDPEELSEGSDSGEKSDVPVRLLSDFTIYDKKTREVLPAGVLMELQYSSSRYGASGLVKAWADDSEEDEDEVEVNELDDLGQRVQLSEILELNIHDFSEHKQRLDSKIYIRTKFAWYILDTPAESYLSYFSAFWIQHRIFHLLVSESLANPRITYESFIKFLNIMPDTADAVAIAIKIIGRELTEFDVKSEDVKCYAIANIGELQEKKIKIGRVPLIRFLFGDDVDYNEEEEDKSSHSTRKPPSTRKPGNPSTMTGNREKDVLKHRNQTVVTPRVGRIAQGLFELTLQVAGQASPEPDEDDDMLAQAIKNTKAHRTDPSSMKWLEPADQQGYYVSVSVDGVMYSVGDVVMVSPGTDDNKTRGDNSATESAQTTNSLGNKLWFCKICYFFDRKGRKTLHGQWFSHGSKTLLQETAHTKALFLMNSCDDMPVAAIYQKCNFRWLGICELEPDDNNPEIENDFHCGLTWDEDDSSLVDLPTERELLEVISSCPKDEPCFSCGLRFQQDFKAQPRPLPGGGLSHHGVSYHVNDFVYIKRPGSGLYQIAQIEKIRAMQTPLEIAVCIYDRYDDPKYQEHKKSGPQVTDNRRLIKTTVTKIRHPDDLDGLCYVSYLIDPDAIDDWVQYADHYYVNQLAKSASHVVPLDPENFLHCKKCVNERVDRLRHNEALLAKNGPLRGLELFSGAGGLGTGFELSGFVETAAAVEFSPGAAKTYQANHPNTVVYNQCSNLLLQHAIDCYDGKNPKQLMSLKDDKTPVPKMPRKGEMDFVFGGPPCQSFSGANHFKKANDIRSTLVCNMLSEVEFYEPSYFLLENVTGLLLFPLNGRQVDRTVVGGIKMGVVKFIFRALIGLGYQVRVKVLQAGQYGAPQGRTRVIFWGAKRGCPLPTFPPPTHSFPKPSQHYKLPTGDYLRPATGSKNPDDPHQAAPLPPVTVNDAIGDLPGFDWKNPHKLSSASAKDKAEVVSRTRIGIPSFNAEPSQGEQGYPGYAKATYARPPQNRYQKWLRSGIKDDKVKYHYTRRFGANTIERSWNIPLRPDTDHTDLPHKLRVKRYDGRVMAKTASVYGRIDGKRHFKTAMTTVRPSNKGSRLLHPTQKRIVSVRECARAQGFPDSYEFLSVNKKPAAIIEDQYRQIGNAVPVPLALALGRSLGEVLLKVWEDRERAGSPEL